MRDDVENPLEDLPRLFMTHIFRPKHLDLIAFLEERLEVDRAFIDELSRRAAPADLIDKVSTSVAQLERDLEKARADLNAFDAKYR